MITQGTGALTLPDGMQPGPALPLDAALRQHVAPIEGVAHVRLLARSRRLGRDINKVYVVLQAHDVDRDRRIVDIMSQLDEVDYDLVPVAAASMIPDEAFVL
jgi:hypothetical protein